MDEIVRMITHDGAVKAISLTGKTLVEQARQIHHTWPVATAALGRTLMGAAMIGCDLKTDAGSVTVQIKGGGPVGTITAVADSHGNPRGYVTNPQVELPRKYEGKLDVGAAVGTDGTLTVIKDLGMKEPYIGSIPLVSGEIAEDLTAYFAASEQLPTACALGVLLDREGRVLQAGGYLVQLLPGGDDSEAERLEELVRAFGPITTALSQGLDAQQVLEKLLEGWQPDLLDRSPISYQCDCSRDRVERALISLGKAELTDMIEKEGKAELTCQFCDKVYSFTKEDLQGLLASATKP